MPQQKLNHKQSTQVGYELQRTIRAVDGDITDSGISDPRFPKKQNSYFENGTMKEHKTAPKGVVLICLSFSLSAPLLYSVDILTDPDKGMPLSSSLSPTLISGINGGRSNVATKLFTMTPLRSQLGRRFKAFCLFCVY